MVRNTYGNIGVAPPPNPPLAQDSDCQLVMVPSFLAPILILAYADGRTPAMVSSVARSRNSLTGLPPLSLERLAHSTPQRSAANLLPKPPPTWSIWTLICVAGNCRLLARSPPMPETFCVEGQNIMPSPLHCMACPCGSRQQ